MDSIKFTQNSNNRFFNTYTKTEGQKTVFCYRTGMDVYEEQFYSGRIVSAGMNAAGFPQNILDSCPERLGSGDFHPYDVFSFEVDGRSFGGNLIIENFERSVEVRENQTEYEHIILTLKNAEIPLTVKLHTELDGTDVFVRYLEIINNSNKSVAISNIVPLCGCAEEFYASNEYGKNGENSDIYSLGYMDCATWGHEGLFRWHTMQKGGKSISGRYDSDKWRHPMLLIRNNLLGGIFNIQFAHTGGYSFDLNLLNDPQPSGMMGQNTFVSRLEFAVKIKSENPQAVLLSGESIITPAVHFCKTFGSLDTSVNTMHDHIRRSVFILPKPQGSVGMLTCGMGPERLMDFNAIKHFADTACEVGAEMFTLDAGWYCEPNRENDWPAYVGDWFFNENLYPNGAEEIVEYVHSKGLKFGLWLDCERLGRSSKIRAEHPDWVGKQCYNGEPCTVIDFTNKEAAQWIENELIRIFDKYSIDLFRLDFNAASREMFCEGVKDSVKYCTTLEYCNNINAMYERLRRRFPNMMFENCAGGGGRTDIGIVKNFTHTWVSDWQVAPRSFAITNGMTIALPPEYVDRLASGMYSHTRGSLDFIIRHTLFGKPTTNSYAPVGAEPNPVQLAFVKHTYKIYKDFVQPYMCDGNIYHHTPEIYSTRPVGVGILERASKDRTKSIIGVFKLGDSNDDADITVYPRGIDIAGKYRVMFDNLLLSGASEQGSVVSGFELVNNGIHVHCEGSLTSELILLEKTE